MPKHMDKRRLREFVEEHGLCYALSEIDPSSITSWELSLLWEEVEKGLQRIERLLNL